MFFKLCSQKIDGILEQMMFADKYLSINYFLAKWRLLFISVFYSFSSTFCVKKNFYSEQKILFRLVKWLMYIFRWGVGVGFQSMSDSGALLGMPNDLENVAIFYVQTLTWIILHCCSKLVCIHFGSWDNSREWTVALPEGESIQVCRLKIPI